jgi:hypothetical protein
MRIFLDDERSPRSTTWAPWHKDGECWAWEIVRDVDAFKKLVLEQGIPEVVSLDHDLCDMHYAIHADPGIKKIVEEDLKRTIPPTGHDALKWLLFRCIEMRCKRPVVYIHTMNPVGRDNMQSLVDSFDQFNPNLVP